MFIDLDVDPKRYDVIVEKTKNGFRVSTIEIKKDKVLIDYTSSEELDSEIQTVYRDKNGNHFIKKTKHRPENAFSKSYHDWYLVPGMKNQYDHTVINCYRQYKFKI